MDRRDFLKVTAATGASGALAGCGNPEHQIIRFIPEETLTPGIARWKPSICPLCSAGCGMLVRIMDGDAEVTRKDEAGVIERGLAKKLEGSPAHPISQGRLCVRGQAAIQIAYHPDRIAHPLKRSGERGSGAFRPVTWDEALSDLLSRFDALASNANQKSLSFLTRPLQGQRQALISQFLARFGAPPPFEFQIFDERIIRLANGLSFGYEQLPTFDIAHSRYILAFGADFLGTWNSPVAQSIGYGEMRQGRPGERGKLVQVESRMSQTGANADEWVPVRPGTEGALALGIAHVIMKERLRSESDAGKAGALIDGWRNGLPEYAPENVEKRTGVAASRVERLAREFAANRPSVAMIGGIPLAQTNGLFHALAVNALNALVGAVGQPGGMSFTPQPSRVAGSESPSLDRFAQNILNSAKPPVQLLLLHDANPVFTTPPSWRMKDALLKVPYIASFGSFIDETSILSDLILPDHSFLESWVDHVPESGASGTLVSVAAPAMQPLLDTRAMPDVLIEISRRLNKPLTPAFEWKTYPEMLQHAYASTPSSDWDGIQQRGGLWGEPSPGASRRPLPEGEGTPSLRSARKAPGEGMTFAEPQFDGAATQYPYYFFPYASQAFLDGSLAHLPWLQELPDVLSTAMWSSWVEINPKTADALGIRQGDLLEVASAHGSLQAPALLFPGIAPDLIAMPAGQGHANFTRYASGRGANPFSILGGLTEPETGALAWASTRVRIAKVSANGDLILFAGSLRERDEHGR
jgi:anaerobic selenocysteine-containing dehydrogenase